MRAQLGLVMVAAGVGAIVLAYLVGVNGAVFILALVMCIAGALLAQSGKRREEKK